MTAQTQPGVKWSGPRGAKPITLADFGERGTRRDADRERGRAASRSRGAER